MLGIMIGLAVTALTIIFLVVEVAVILGLGLLETGYLAGSSLLSEIQMCLPFGYVNKMEKRRLKERISLTKLMIERASWTDEWIKENGKKQKAKDDRYIRRTMLLTRLWSAGLFLPQGLAQVFAFRLPTIGNDKEWMKAEGSMSGFNHAFRTSIKLLIVGTCFKMTFPDAPLFGLPIKTSEGFFGALPFGVACAIVIPLILKLLEMTASIRLRYLAMRTHKMAVLMKFPCTLDRYVNAAEIEALKTSLAQAEDEKGTRYGGEDADMMLYGFDPRIEKTDDMKQREAAKAAPTSLQEKMLRRRYCSMSAYDVYTDSMFEDKETRKLYADYRRMKSDFDVKSQAISSQKLIQPATFQEDAQFWMTLLDDETAKACTSFSDFTDNYEKLQKGGRMSRMEIEEDSGIWTEDMSDAETDIDDYEDDYRFAYGYTLGDTEGKAPEPSVYDKIKAKYDAVKPDWEVSCANGLISRWRDSSDPIIQQAVKAYDDQMTRQAVAAKAAANL